MLSERSLRRWAPPSARCGASRRCLRVAVSLAAARAWAPAPRRSADAQRGRAGRAGLSTGRRRRARRRRSNSASRPSLQTERSATFAGEMTAIPGTARMAMRIDMQERLPGEALFHTSAPRARRVARLRRRGQGLQVPQAGHQPVGARRLPRRCALPLAERQGSRDQARANCAAHRRRCAQPDRHAARSPPSSLAAPLGRRLGPLEWADDEDEDPPELRRAHVRCTCGNEFITRATRDELHVEVCSNCHPFYTGRQKLMDTGGRVERFQRRVAKGRLHSAQTRSAQ